MSLPPPAPRLEATYSGQPCAAGEGWDPCQQPVLPYGCLDDPQTSTQPLEESGPPTHLVHMPLTSACLHGPHTATAKLEDITTALLHGPQTPVWPPVASQTLPSRGSSSVACHCLEPGGPCGISSRLLHTITPTLLGNDMLSLPVTAMFPVWTLSTAYAPLHFSIFPPLHDIFVQHSSISHPPTYPAPQE